MSEISRQKDRLTLRVGCDLVASMVREFGKELRSALREEPGEIVLDMAGVETIDSVGLGLLIALHNSLREMRGEMSVVNVSANIHSMFKTMRLDRHFSVQGVEH